MNSKNNIFIIQTALIPIIFWNFYWYIGFNANITKMFVFVFALLFLIRYLPKITYGLTKHNGTNQYLKCISWFVIIVLLSVVNAYIYWGQSPNLTFRSGVGIFVLISFYYFIRKDPEPQLLERTVFLLSVIYLILWLFALSQAPNVVFGNLESVQDDRGFYRILQLAGLDTVVFTYFYCLTQLPEAKGKRRPFMALFIIICLLAIFLSLTRTIIIAVLLFTILYVIRKKSIIFIMLTMIVFLVSSKYILSNEIVSSLFELTTESSLSDQRAPEYLMAFKLYPFHIGTFLFGNGSEHIASSYGQMEALLKARYAFNRSDAGFVGVYVTYGIIGLFMLLFILLKVINQRVSERYYYLKLFIYFVYFSNLTAYHFSDYGFTLVLSLFILGREAKN